ncbi:hypothetical protein OG528_29305 [Streptomyces platensis]|uniref:hypothetical protein n=1 Tax=Streptomyces platensis TaxID=58346 RepID=UPI0030DEF6DB
MTSSLGVAATGASTEAILDGLKLAGPDVAPPGAQFAPALMQCAVALRPASVADSDAGQQLRELLGTVLNAALPVPAPPSPRGWGRDGRR